MITPKSYKVEDFFPGDADSRYVKALKAEALMGSELIDNLILLKFVDTYTVQAVLRDTYGIPFAWLNIDPTPPEYRELADKYGIIIDRSRGMTVYIPLGTPVDDATLHIDIPEYEITYRFIADANYRLLKTGGSSDLLSLSVANYRPLLVFKRLIADCIDRAGTNMQFESGFSLETKQPVHRIRYRIKKELFPSFFKIDKQMMQYILQTVISKITPASASDLDSPSGVTTEVRDLFEDGTCDLRITGFRIDAGFYVDIAIQTTTTTTKKVEELGFPIEDVERIRSIAERRVGLTLVTGEMRSGKNTTIFAMINEIVDQPIRIIEYSNPIENHMPFPQLNYRGDLQLLKDAMRMAKKQDIDIAILNEIPDAAVAFAVRDLVNSAIGVITTTHIDRLWHLPLKLEEFFGKDYKTIVSQLNACINHKMFRRWRAPNMQKRLLVKEHGDFEMFCYKYGVRQYFVPDEPEKVKYELQPLTEILVFTDAIKLALLNFDEVAKAEQMLQSQLDQRHCRLENKVAEYINRGEFSLDEMKRLFMGGA